MSAIPKGNVWFLISCVALSVACGPVDARQPGLRQAALGGAAGNGAVAPSEPGAGGGSGSGETVDPGAACPEDAGSCLSQGGSVPGCVPAGARDCSSASDNDCDGQPDDVSDDVCRCLPGSVEPCDEHPGLDARGACRAGSHTCVVGEGKTTSDWGACEGAVGPLGSDACGIVGDDSDCNGIPNSGCSCVAGQTAPCGPSTDDGICQRGISTCENGAFGACVGAVFPAARDCGSADDKNCDGRPDDTIDNVCTCVLGDIQLCGEHPGRDGTGQCRAGQRRCELGPNSLTSRFGGCTGSVGPALQDVCAAVGDDANCDGIGCECVPALGSAACAGDASNSRCNTLGQCVPCVLDADCSLVSGGRSSCSAGACILKLPDGSPCREDPECLGGLCRQQFPNADGDAFPNLPGLGAGFCGNALQPGLAFARLDGQTDCCDDDARVFPGAIPPTPPAELVPIGGVLGYAEPNGCGDYDYDCDNVATSTGRQTQTFFSCSSIPVDGLPAEEAQALCRTQSGWSIDIPDCGVTASYDACSMVGDICIRAAVPTEPRVCF